MKSFKQFMAEGNKLNRIKASLEKGHSIGTVSPEREGMSPEEKKAAHAKIKSTLAQLSQRGYVGFTGPHKGRYKYSGTEEPAKEGSYVVKSRKANAERHFDSIMKGLGSRFKQQSVMRVKPKGDGDLLYTDKENKGKTERLGKIHYNRPLKTGSGDTQLKHGGSFTVQEAKK